MEVVAKIEHIDGENVSAVFFTADGETCRTLKPEVINQLQDMGLLIQSGYFKVEDYKDGYKLKPMKDELL